MARAAKNQIEHFPAPSATPRPDVDVGVLGGPVAAMQQEIAQRFSQIPPLASPDLGLADAFERTVARLSRLSGPAALVGFCAGLGWLIWG